MKQKNKRSNLKEKEADITRAIRDLLNICGIFHFKHWGGPMSTKGISDIIGCKKTKVADLVKAGIEEIGVSVAIEIKAPGKIPSGPIETWNKHEQEQNRFLMNIRDSCGIGFFADSIEDVIRELKLENVINGPLFKNSKNLDK